MGSSATKETPVTEKKFAPYISPLEKEKEVHQKALDLEQLLKDEDFLSVTALWNKLAATHSFDITVVLFEEAAEKGYLNLLEFIGDNPELLHRVKSTGKLALDFAVQRAARGNHVAAVRYLVSKGADPQMVSRTASETNNVPLLKIALEKFHSMSDNNDFLTAAYYHSRGIIDYLGSRGMITKLTLSEAISESMRQGGRELTRYLSDLAVASDTPLYAGW